MSTTDAIRKHAKSRPHHPAIDDLRARRVVTYAELPRLVDGAVSNLLDLGVKAQDIVGVMLPDSADHIIARLALEEIGAVIIPIGRTLPGREKRKAIDDLDVEAVITNSKYSRTVPPGPRRLNIETICAERAALGEDPPIPAGGIDPGLPLIATKSSGTTGNPKRLLLSRAHIWERSRTPIGPMGLTSETRFLQLPSLEYVHGYGLTLTTLMIGGTVVISRPKFDYFENMANENITLVCVSPSHLQGILSGMKDETPRLPNLTIALTGAPAAADLRSLSRRKLTPKLIDWYGTSEVGGLSIAAPLDHEKYPDSVGRPLDGIEAQVVDEDGQRLPAMEIGEIGFRTAQFPAEYHRNPEATARHFRDGWFYPGDFAAVNDDGYIFLMGRTDDAINHAGINFYPIETERVLRSHPAVLDAAVFALDRPGYGEVPVAAVVASDFVTPRTLEKFCDKKLAAHKHPRWIQIIPELPRNLAGKVMKSKLADMVDPPWTVRQTAKKRGARS